MITKLTNDKIIKYKNDGFLCLTNFFSLKEKTRLKKEISKVEKFSKKEKKKWMFYYEEKKNNKNVSRIENFLQYNPYLKKIFIGHKMMNILSSLINGKVEIYKEKINFKYPKGDGFKPHQDMQAGWKKINNRKYISLAIAIDKSTKKNGCIEVVSGKHKKGLLGKKFKPLPKKLVSIFKWQKINQNLGDVIFFDGYTPHRSKKNLSNRKRRIVYITYCNYFNGNLRKEYFDKKRIEFPPNIERDKNKKYNYKI